MKHKKIAILITATAIAGLMATTVFAATRPAMGGWVSQTADTTGEAPTTEAMPGFGMGRMPGEDFADMTEEEKAAFEAEMAGRRAEMDATRAEMAAERAAAEEKWNALTDAEKESIYALKDKAIDAEIETVDKYLSYGLITEEDAAAMKENLANKKTAIRESGALSVFGGGRGHHMGGGMRGMMPPDGTAPVAPDTAAAAVL